MVSKQLISVAILWHELWHEALEDASRLYFGQGDVMGMLDRLKDLHQKLNAGPSTPHEVSFYQQFHKELSRAYIWTQQYLSSGDIEDMNNAWDLYYSAFRRINKQLPQMMSLELKLVSPELLEARTMELAVPGTYKVGKPIYRIEYFCPSLQVFNSKQRPRRLAITDCGGLDWSFLLKGHEDLRQDERVMQLFGLVNALFKKDVRTRNNDLGIYRYSVIPLSPNSGLLGWVVHSDTMHQLIREYRNTVGVALNVEHKIMLREAPDYERLPLLQKVEIFEYSLSPEAQNEPDCQGTYGTDLERVLWLKSPNSEVWMSRRCNFTRSTAVMSMVGYILGLGDRHPSNIMLHRHTGKVIHIDFGDCFEVAMKREKYPEKIPFRLTGMLVKAMEVSGIEGNFKTTCAHAMTVMREQSESLLAVLDTFVHDPLINWRLDADTPHAQNDPENGLNAEAVKVMGRIMEKLTGRDFGTKVLSVPEQVDALLSLATSSENLVQCYTGWCPFW